MKTTLCDQTVVALQLGLTPPSNEHLESCPGCREEARALGVVFGELSATALVAPPRQVDAQVRRAIALASGGRRMALRAVPAILLATLGLGGFVTCLAMLLTLTPLGEAAPVVAVGLVSAYLAVCAAASTPLLIRHRRAFAHARQETI